MGRFDEMARATDAAARAATNDALRDDESMDAATFELDEGRTQTVSAALQSDEEAREDCRGARSPRAARRTPA